MIRDKVIGVNLFPLKGGHAATVNGEQPTQLHVGRTGLEEYGVRDRDFVLFDPAENNFVSQRGYGADRRRVKYPQDRFLAGVHVDIQPDHLAFSSIVGTIEVPTAPDANTQRARRIVDIWGKQMPVVEQGEEANDYFSRLLGRRVLLTRSDRERPRIVPGRYQREGAFNEAAGMDGLPLSLYSQATLDYQHQVNGMEPGTVPMSRYRGGIIIAGDELGPGGEDYINPQVLFEIGEGESAVGMWVSKALSRCVVTNFDQESGEQVGQGLRVLRGRGGAIFTGETGVFFGQGVVHANEGTVIIGDPVLVHALSDTPNIEFQNAA